jgi:hypothetical protein
MIDAELSVLEVVPSSQMKPLVTMPIWVVLPPGNGNENGRVCTDRTSSPAGRLAESGATKFRGTE